VANLINAGPEEIIFTSSGAEANNMAIKGVAFAGQKKGKHIIVSSIEHHSVLNSARFLERLDFEATFLPVDEYGLIDQKPYGRKPFWCPSCMPTMKSARLSPFLN
jgi:cysteine desulfurase